ncbi:tRNA (N6-threonylcarbamoyladenosine(37)-N6)-methyltransferase TrmO [Oceanidesulfovibrio indonesiensis]|uniref:tRNA (N6-threonylcarbamoyladenosine(37)-N6)-methyltransferase TrmO n=1 Tax=Oceanidesulfovibrio indonesiensis TaxID=54767 RepID=A0A7M3ME48_9BACT|nr:tRNA (N6-threonylcarbamoyladenosine(37)-N6)-methyltransferase TrmO [Oceanidesulfovibrio indonesiensis]TVM17071.1 tRNA (N6-threonylcarbamoyladenosine(37)-N6)-methyltransferase TrmO [Oceanidesulfovibrio indonesiensis]
MDKELCIIGYVESSLTSKDEAPKMEDENAPQAMVRIDPVYRAAMQNLAPGDDVILLTWLHEANRSYLQVHPRGDVHREKRGVFSTRSPDRPNPIGIHRVTLLAVDNGEEPSILVDGIEALNGTPVLDIKPVARTYRSDEEL